MRAFFIIATAVSMCAMTLCAEETNAPAPAIEAAEPAVEPTIVTSERLQVDYAHNFGTFEGNVLAVDPRITVRADKMIVFFGSGAGTNEARSVKKIIAEGAVVITQEDKKSQSDRAEYTAAEGKVVLTGNPSVQSPNGVVTGQRITFWRGQEKMDVESGASVTNRTRLVLYPEEEKKKSSEHPAEETK